MIRRFVYLFFLEKRITKNNKIPYKKIVIDKYLIYNIKYK